MMEGVNLYSISYYEKTVFKGSYRGICFRIGKVDEPEKCLRAQAWKGPYILEKTDEEIFEEFFDFTDEGLKQANEWIEAKQAELII
ncbi:MAG: hypothetical protein K5639_08185 [Eubacterium sp.]|nr:hypothetical protein [Eubacterium sp.]